MFANCSIYNHSYSRVEYPLERGYRMELTPLPRWIRVAIENDLDSKKVIVLSRIHKNKVYKLARSYSTEFSDSEILEDISGRLTPWL